MCGELDRARLARFRRLEPNANASLLSPVGTWARALTATKGNGARGKSVNVQVLFILPLENAWR